MTQLIHTIEPVDEIKVLIIYEPRCEKTGLRGFQPGLIQIGLYSHRKWLEAWNFRI